MDRSSTVAAAIALLITGLGAQQYEWRTTATTFGSAVGSSLTFDPLRGRTVMTRWDETWEWDGAVWQRRIAGNPMGARTTPGYTFDLGRGVAVLFAGQGLGASIADTWEYDGLAWTRIITATTPPWRWFGAMTYDTVRQRVYLVGGDTGGGAGLNDMWEYDGVDWTQLFPANSPTSRLRHAITFDEARARIVLFGGLNASLVKLDETWEWNGIDWTQRTPGVRPPARMNHAMAYDVARSRTVMFGGIDLPISYSDTWEWDGNTWTQVAIGQPAPRIASSHSMSYDRSRGEIVQLEVLFAGGGDTWTFDGSGWQIAVPAESPIPIDNHALAHDPVRGEILMFGQSSLTGFQPTDTWVHRGGLWQRLDPPTTPAGRIDPALAFDSVTGNVLMFGGATPTAVDETWLWSGVDWQLLTPANSPPARVAAALASDVARGRVVLFGGQNGPTPRNDTWEWDGANWLQRSPPTIPPGRLSHGMSFDPIRNVTVMFGGGDLVFGPTLGDHWEWNGIDWTQIVAGTMPAARAGHGLVFDPVTQTTVVLGGSYVPFPAFPVAHNDVWEWDGVQWTQRVVVGTQPLPRRLIRAAHDPATRRTLVYGGDSRNDTWLLGLPSNAAAASYGVGCPGTWPRLNPLAVARRPGTPRVQ